MINTLVSRFSIESYKRDIFYVIFFGILSVFFANIKFYIPGFEGLESNFREVPLLISIFYIRNPLYIILLSLITTIYTAEGIPYLLNFSLHLVSLLAAWAIYYYTKKYIKAVFPKSFAWAINVIVYYALLIMPIYIVFGKMLGHLSELNFIENYVSMFNSLFIEGFTTLLITSLYLMQFEKSEALVTHKNNLENLVNSRTEELALANKTLTYLNENLDDLVQHRSRKIQDQLNLIIRYAHMNSHEVRAPLARILGLLEIIKLEKSIDHNSKVVKDLYLSGKELDDVINSMNRLLEKEIDSNEIS